MFIKIFHGNKMNDVNKEIKDWCDKMDKQFSGFFMHSVAQSECTDGDFFHITITIVYNV